MTLFPSSRDEAQGANKTKCSKPLSKHMINDDCQLKGTKIVTESNSQARLGGVSEIMLIEIRNCGWDYSKAWDPWLNKKEKVN